MLHSEILAQNKQNKNKNQLAPLWLVRNPPEKVRDLDRVTRSV